MIQGSDTFDGKPVGEWVKYEDHQKAEIEIQHLRAALAVAEANARHPEDYCENCGGLNFTWFVKNELWNKYAGDSDIICPICFVSMAYVQGFDPAWELVPENLHE